MAAGSYQLTPHFQGFFRPVATGHPGITYALGQLTVIELLNIQGC